ncbi:MAG: BASS family bile acid:Na+ symporter, partial [Pirellulaceae bacterium]
MRINSVNILLVALILSGIAAFKFPAPFLALLDGRLSILIGVTMFFIGAMLTPKQVDGVLKRWPTVLGGTAIQYALMPLICFCVAKGMGATGDMLVGIMIVGCVPGAMASNVLTLTAGGNTSYSVSLTTSATILSPFVVPLTLALTLSQSTVTIDVQKTFIELLLTVLIPVVTGHLFRRWVPKSARMSELISPWVANIAILLIIAFVVAKFADELQTHLVQLFIPLLLINALGYVGGYFGGKLLGIPEAMRRALTLEVGM